MVTPNLSNNNEIAVFIISPVGADFDEMAKYHIEADVFRDTYGTGVHFNFIDGEICLNPNFLLDYVVPEHSILIFTWLDQTDKVQIYFIDNEDSIVKFIKLLRAKSHNEKSSNIVWDVSMELLDKLEIETIQV